MRKVWTWLCLGLHTQRMCPHLPICSGLQDMQMGQYPLRTALTWGHCLIHKLTSTLFREVPSENLSYLIECVSVWLTSHHIVSHFNSEGNMDQMFPTLLLARPCPFHHLSSCVNMLFHSSHQSCLRHSLELLYSYAEYSGKVCIETYSLVCKRKKMKSFVVLFHHRKQLRLTLLPSMCQPKNNSFTRWLHFRCH